MNQGDIGEGVELPTWAAVLVAIITAAGGWRFLVPLFGRLLANHGQQKWLKSYQNLIDEHLKLSEKLVESDRKHRELLRERDEEINRLRYEIDNLKSIDHRGSTELPVDPDEYDSGFCGS